MSNTDSPADEKFFQEHLPDYAPQDPKKIIRTDVNFCFWVILDEKNKTKAKILFMQIRPLGSTNFLTSQQIIK